MQVEKELGMFKKMLGSRHVVCNSGILLDAPGDNSLNSNESKFMSAKKQLAQVEVDGSFFPSSEDDVIGVEHLLAEPKCNDLGDGFLGFDTCNAQKYFDGEEPSALENAYIKIDSDMLDCKLATLGEKTKVFLDKMLEGTDEAVLDGRNNFSDTCEDYLLDNEFCDPNCNPNKASYMGRLVLESQPAASGGRDCGAEMSELSTSSIPVPDAKCYQNSSLLDKMAIDELHEAFRKIFGRETSIIDKKWLKHRILFGLKNLVDMDYSSGLLECDVTSETEGQVILTASDDCFFRASRPLTGIFNFKTKPRVRTVKRRHSGSDSSKTMTMEVSQVVFGSTDLVEKECMVDTKKRLRKPTRRYIEESLEQKSRYRRRKCEISDKISAGKFLQSGSRKKQRRKGYGAIPLIHRKESFKGACIQVPFGLPVQTGCSTKRGESKDCQDRELGCLNMDSIIDCSADSLDDMSEDDYTTRSKTQKSKSRRKHHMFWSLPEVLKLIEGVSKYGVGRWIEIKRVMFPSSENRTSVDLKDKWRNLLKASCLHSQSKREVEAGRRHTSQSIPQSILRRVRELAVIYPYPRERKNQFSQTMPVDATIHAATHDKSVSLSSEVRAVSAQ